MNEIETTLDTHTPYPALYTDHVIHAMIFGGILIGCVYGILVPLFHPSLEFLAKHGWSSFIILPSLLWFAMGMALLLVGMTSPFTQP